MFSKSKIKFAPIEEYTKSSRTRKRAEKRGISFLLIVELLLAGFLGYEVISNDFHNRVIREYEMRQNGEIVLPSGNYTGETDFGYFFGEGCFTFTSGAVYTGTWSDNSLNGYAELNIPSEGTYVGEFVNSQKNGHGVFTWEDGSIYDGEWAADVMSGRGTYTGAGGAVFSGMFADNRLQQGSCVFQNNIGKFRIDYVNGVITSAHIDYWDGTVYNGSVNETTLNGEGKMTFSDGGSYDGSYLNGVREGNGTYYWANGDKYDGGWQNDEMSGSGVYTFEDGSTLQGTFSNNKFTDGSYYIVNDFGDYTFTITAGIPIAVNMTLNDGTTYSGDLKDEQLNGQAQITYSNGDTYSGQVENGVKNGTGTYTWTSGASYSGSWENDRMSGRGTYMYSSSETGYKLVGTFVNGVPDGECDYYTSSTTSYKTTWSNGKCVKVTE